LAVWQQTSTSRVLGVLEKRVLSENSFGLSDFGVGKKTIESNIENKTYQNWVSLNQDAEENPRTRRKLCKGYNAWVSIVSRAKRVSSATPKECHSQTEIFDE
jgi:hypothetical protein